MHFLRSFLPCTALAIAVLVPAYGTSATPETERQYLSGHSPADAVPWEFTVSAGRRAGEVTTIPVPSNWDLQGFGSQNYGQVPVKSSEHGLYRTKFTVPDSWKGRRVRLVFDGVMTDTRVTLNAQSAGSVHQGGFTRFRYDITPLLKFGAENQLEVEVAKVSADANTERAERGGDYWVFGGIYRAVWLEALPGQAIEQVAINAGSDGTFTAQVTLSLVQTADAVEAQIVAADGTLVGAPFASTIAGGGAGSVQLATRIEAPRLWTAETPHLYTVRLTLRRGAETLHTLNQRFGFRTFEVRAGQGLFLNGQRILLKGVNRHSVRPASGRALTPADCVADVHLIQSMNMNAVRMSHYPPDEAFLEACDELGLYVLDELSGWQHAHGTPIGRILVREMVERDVNHPSILFWDNGNEGGWNRALDGEFALYDPQRRPVLHPWEAFSGVDTKHYPPFEDLTRRLKGPHLVMPTEFLHGLYDGGMAAGLADYWHAIETSPFGAGGFLWVLADDGIVRGDQGGRIDAFSTFGPDGIVGPNHEKEGSYYSVRDIWAPVQIDAPTLDAAFAGSLTVHNRYDFTSLANCRFAWRLLRFDAGKATAVSSGVVAGPDIAPHASGQLRLALPATWREADVLALTALDPNGAELWTWTWPTPMLAKGGARLASVQQPEPAAAGAAVAPVIETTSSQIILRAGAVSAEFDPATGLLRTWRRGDKPAALTHGPRLAFARPANAAPIVWTSLPVEKESGPVAGDQGQPTQATLFALPTPRLAHALELSVAHDKDQSWVGMTLELSADGVTWRTLFASSRRPGDGYTFTFPPQLIGAVRVTDLRTADGRAVALKSMRLGYAAGRFPLPNHGGTVTTGRGTDAQTGKPTAWIESRNLAGLDLARWTLSGDGTLELAYAYALEGDFIHHGITFDHPEEQMTGMRWLGEGPFRVWQNRRRGTWLDVHETIRHNQQPGEQWSYPEFEGCFAGVRWARLATVAGALTIDGMAENTFLRVGTPRATHPQTMVDFPAGSLSVLHAIPAMGSKFKPADVAGPSGAPAHASGTYQGTVRFRFRE